LDNTVTTPPPIRTSQPTLTQEELAIITLLRSNSYQEISIQVQDSVITSVDQTIKFRRKKGGGLIFGARKVTRTVLTPTEIEVISRLREKPYQRLTITVMDSEIIGFDQTVKFKKKN